MGRVAGQVVLLVVRLLLGLALGALVVGLTLLALLGVRLALGLRGLAALLGCGHSGGVSVWVRMRCSQVVRPGWVGGEEGVRVGGFCCLEWMKGLPKVSNFASFHTICEPTYNKLGDCSVR